MLARLKNKKGGETATSANGTHDFFFWSRKKKKIHVHGKHDPKTPKTHPSPFRHRWYHCITPFFPYSFRPGNFEFGDGEEGEMVKTTTAIKKKSWETPLYSLNP